MSWFLRRRPEPEAEPLDRQVPTAGEQFSAGFRAQQIEDDSWSRGLTHVRDLRSQIVDMLGGEDALDMPSVIAGLPHYDPFTGDYETLLTQRAVQLAAEAAARDPGQWAGMPWLTAEDPLVGFQSEALRRRRAEWEEQQEILDLGGSSVAQFGGAMAGAATDEVTVFSLPLGAGSLARGMAMRFIATEAAIGAGAEAAILPRAGQVAEDLDLPPPDALSRITTGAAIGGVFAGVLTAGARAVDYARTMRNAESQMRPADVSGPDFSAEVQQVEIDMRTGTEGVAPAEVLMVNNGVRSRPIRPSLSEGIGQSVAIVYGPGYTVRVYSGGQPGAGSGRPRTGSIRHDVDEQGLGRAADVHVFGPDGRQLTGDELAPLVQYWVANRMGGVGVEMRGGGLHLDDWTTPPPGGGMVWNYSGQGGQYTPGQRAAVAAGLRGEQPILRGGHPAGPAGSPLARFDFNPGASAGHDTNPVGYVFGRLMTLGYEPRVAAALVGNLMQESGPGLNTRATGDGGNAFGMAQWNGPRRQAYLAFAQSRGVDPSDIDAQIAFLHQELQTTERAALQAILAAPDAASAARVASDRFWRPGIPHIEARMGYARALFQQFEAGAVPRSGRPVAAGARTAGATGQPFDLGPDPRRPGMTRNDQVISPAGTRIEVEYEVVDLASLQRASGDLQPRDRSRAASDEQISEIAAGLDPARLMPGPEADRGAPIVGRDNVVESGNGRVAALVRAAERHPERYQAYVDRIRAEGFDVPEGMERPVLIARRTTDFSPERRRDWVRENNTSAIARMGAAEQARVDAAYLSQNAMDAFQPAAPLGSRENAEFIRRVLAGMPQAERAALYAGNRLGLDGVRRIEAALFARAWGADDLLRLLVESPDPGTRALIEMMQGLAPEWAQFRAMIEASFIRAEFDITDQVVGMVRIIAQSRAADREGQSVIGAIRDFLATPDMLNPRDDTMNAALLEVFYRGDTARRPAEAGDILRRYVAETAVVGRADTEDLLMRPPAPPEVLARAVSDQAKGTPLPEAPKIPPQPRPEPIEALPATRGVDTDQGAQSPALVRLADETVADLRAAVEAPPASPVVAGTIEDLRSLVEAGAARDVLNNHPAVARALAEMQARPETAQSANFGTADWHRVRSYRVDGQTVVGTENALLSMERQANELAWRELKLAPEPVARERELVIVLGPPAAGKSTIANDIAVARRAAILDSDEIKKTLPEFDGGLGASAVHEESSILAKALQDVLIDRGTNVVLPKVGENPASIQRVMDIYKARGYSVSIVNMAVSPENAYRRMIGRFASTGRIIPPSYLDMVGSRPGETYKALRGKADGYAEINNDGPFGSIQPVTDRGGIDPLRSSRFALEPGGEQRSRVVPVPPVDRQVGAGQAPAGISEPGTPSRVNLSDSTASSPSPAPSARDAVAVSAADYVALRDVAFRLDEGGPEVRLREVLDDLEADATLVDLMKICGAR